MFTYDFDAVINRRNTNSYKWDSASDPDVLPMWVADMDFRTAPVVREALKKRVEHGIFGYTRVPDAYYDSVIYWFGRKHGWRIKREEIIYTSGVVPAISAIIKALTIPGDKVIVQTPVYNCFFSSIRNNDCEILRNPLIFEEKKGHYSYRMDFDDLEKKAADPRAKLLLLCNPHNPAGRVWTRDELSRLNEICMRNDVLVISDEIHGELAFMKNPYTPFASISEECKKNSIVCCSPSKAFNIAGLQIANIISDNAERRARIDRAININEVCDVNPFGVEALMAAYSEEGELWLEALVAYIYENYLTLRAYFHNFMPQLPVVELEGTYLVWVDCRPLGLDSEVIEKRLVETEKLWLNAGAMYGDDGFMRINIACPRSVLFEGLDRLRRFVDSLP